METLSAVQRFKIVNRIVFICFHLLLCGVDYGEPNTSKICASFTFLTVEGDTLTARENETVVVPFGITNDSCGVSTDFTIRVVEGIVPPRPFCTLLREHGKCFKPLSEKNCDCNNTTGGYQLKKKFSRQDHTFWTWKETHGLIGSRSISFNITYPGSVISLSMNPAEDVVQRNSSVLVNCSWDEGNPPVTARLLDRHGVEMEGSIYSSGQIGYTFPAVGCQDAGLIRCEAPGASHNESVRLLVKCPPEFNTGKNFTAEKNAPTNLIFPLRTYTTNFSDCLLQKISETACERNCTSFVSLAGSPPDLTLTLEFGRLCSEKNGTWNLTLFNDGGQGSVEFSLIKIDQDSVTSKSEDSDQGQSEGSSTLLFLGIGGGVVTVVVVAVVVVLVRHFGKVKTDSMRRKSGDGAQLHSDSAFKDDEVSPRHSGQDEECVMIPNPVYEGTYGRHAPLESPYFEVADSLRKTPQNAENQAAGGPGSNAGNSDYAYVDAEVVQGWKDSARAAKTDDKHPCTPDEYVSVEDIKKRKQQAK